VQGFKIVQQDLEHTRVDVVTGPGWAPNSAQRIIDGFRARLGQGVQVQVNPVDAIAPERSGKYRYVISHAVAAR
jgi:phenylacetate-CoA ligase